MPRISKHKRFKGVQKQFLSKERSSSSSKDSSSTSSITRSAVSTPVSQRKLQSNARVSLDKDCRLETASQTSQGYRLIDLECLQEAMSKLHMCKDGK